MGNGFEFFQQRTPVPPATNTNSSGNGIFAPLYKKLKQAWLLRSVCTFFDINSNRKWLHLLLSSFFLLIFAAQIPYTMKKEFGKWMMDIAKYIVTAVLLATVFSEISDRLTVYLTSVLSVVISLGCGLWLLREQKQEEKKWWDFILSTALFASSPSQAWSSFIIKIRKRSGSRRRTKRLLHLC